MDKLSVLPARTIGNGGKPLKVLGCSRSGQVHPIWARDNSLEPSVSRQLETLRTGLDQFGNPLDIVTKCQAVVD
jgi:hypothetical protein